MIFTAPRLRDLASCALAAVLVACTSSPSPSPNVVDPATITVQPAAITIFPGVPATLLITGGTGSYVVASNNQAIVPIVTAGVGHQLTVIANPVNADTSVALSIRDTGTAPAVTATLTVRPGTIANAVTFTPTSSECNVPAAGNVAEVFFLCSGQEALLNATISQAGQLLPARTARFDVVSGDVRFIVTPVGTTPEVLALTTSALSDQNGRVRVRLRALAGAPNQNALIQITDPETQAFQRVVVPIRQVPGPGGASFFAVPTAFTFTGPFIGQCASSGATVFTVFGGTPPYNIVSAGASAVAVSPAVVTQSGGSFGAQIFSNTCFTDAPISITDASGRVVVVTVTNRQGTQAAPAPAVLLSPDSLTVCATQSGSLVVSGGTTPFSGAANHPALTVAIVDRTVGVTRGAFAAGQPTSATLTVTDGITVDSATILTPAPGTGGCP